MKDHRILALTIEQTPRGVEPLRKPTPRVLEKGIKRAGIEKHRKDIRAQVFARDHGHCRVCQGYATEMHELVFRSRGGQRSLYNSIAVCTALGGNNCHAMLQRHVIEWAFTDDVRGADAPIQFTANRRVWEG